MEPLVAIPNHTSTKNTNSNTKFTPIAPAPAKVQAAPPPPAIILPQATQSLPILTQGPNGTMLLMNTNTIMIPQMVPQLVLSQPLIYGMPTILPSNGTIPISTSGIPTTTGIPMNTNGIPVTTIPTIPSGTSNTKNDEITILNTTSSKPKFDILERAILEISADGKA